MNYKLMEQNDYEAMSRFLIIDDHPLFREALQSAIHQAYNEAKVDEASSLDEALEFLNAQDMYDLALLDLKIPGTHGFEGLLEIRARFPHLPIVVVSGLEDVSIIKNVLSHGASGFIPKSIKKDGLTKAIKSVINGEIFIPDFYHESAAPVTSGGLEVNEVIAKLSSLTPQQLRVIKMLRDGLLNKQIAYELQVGETTVKAHVSEILRKLEVNNRTQAAMRLSQLSSADLDELNGEFDA